MLTTEIWGFAYPEVGDPLFSMVSVQYSCWAPYLFKQLSKKEKSVLGFHLLLVK